jgi:hypothetical protein
MAAYQKVAEQGHEIVRDLVSKYGMDKGDVEQLGFLFNLGIRCGRPVQSTQRKRAVQYALGDLATVRMEEVTDERTGNTYNAIRITAKETGGPDRTG